MFLDDDGSCQGPHTGNEKLSSLAPTSDLAARLLEALDALSVEDMLGMRLDCDGVSRSLSRALLHLGIDHEMHSGSLTVEGVGFVPLHWWIVLPDGSHCDIRARAWLGEDSRVPHGVFMPQAFQRYATRNVEETSSCPLMFWCLTLQELGPFVQKVCGEARYMNPRLQGTGLMA